MFEIEYRPEAQEDMDDLSAYHEGIIIDAVEERLTKEPTVPGSHRKLLVSLVSPWAEAGPIWQLKVGDYRVFYDVIDNVVRIWAVRHKGRLTTGEIL